MKTTTSKFLILAIASLAFGLAQPARATLIVTAWADNRVPNGAITIDGTMSDWTAAGLSPVITDPSNDGSAINYVAGWIAHDDNNFYFRFDAATPFTYAAGWTVFDLDKNPSTGHLLAGMGAERNTNDGLSGTGVLNYWASDGSGPVLTTSHPSTQSVDHVSVEYSIPVSELSGDFYVAWSQSTERMPNNVGSDIYVVEYTNRVPEPTTMALFGVGGLLLWLRRKKIIAGAGRLAAMAVLALLTAHPARATVVAEKLYNPVANGAITIDGNMADWTAAGVQPYQLQTSTLFYEQGWVASDRTTFISASM